MPRSICQKIRWKGLGKVILSQKYRCNADPSVFHQRETINKQVIEFCYGLMERSWKSHEILSQKYRGNPEPSVFYQSRLFA